MSKQNVILKITVREETVRVKMLGYGIKMSAGIAKAMYENKDLEEVISNALIAVKIRRHKKKKAYHEFINHLKTILKEAKEAEDKAEKSDKNDGPY